MLLHVLKLAIGGEVTFEHFEGVWKYPLIQLATFAKFTFARADRRRSGRIRTTLRCSLFCALKRRHPFVGVGGDRKGQERARVQWVRMMGDICEFWKRCLGLVSHTKGDREARRVGVFAPGRCVAAL